MSPPIPCHASGGVFFNPAFQELISRNGLCDFDRIMQREDGAVIKQAIARRKTVRLDLPGGPSVYLKRHYAENLLPAIARLFFPEPTAPDEFRAIQDFHASGIPTVTAIAAGRRSAGLLRTESFLVTLALEGCAKLDEVLAGDLPRQEKLQLLFQVALLARKMHAAGFNHRDLYLCHILRREDGRLYIVDLHRVQRRSRVPERWLVKDLAALHYSAPPAITRADRLRFFMAYRGSARLSPPDKRFIGKILEKTRAMIQHNRPSGLAD